MIINIIKHTKDIYIYIYMSLSGSQSLKFGPLQKHNRNLALWTELSLEQFIFFR